MNKYRNILKESNPSFLSFSFGAFRFFLWHDFVLKNYQSVLPHFFHGRFRDLFLLRPCPPFFSTQPIYPVTASPISLLLFPFIYRVLTPCFQRKVSGGYKYPSKKIPLKSALKTPLTKAKKFFQLFFKNPLTKSKMCGIIYTQQKQRS